MQNAVGEDAGATRRLQRDRRRGWIWNNCRCGIVVKTPPNNVGKRATTIWYGEHVVTWDMIRLAPRPCKDAVLTAAQVAVQKGGRNQNGVET